MTGGYGEDCKTGIVTGSGPAGAQVWVRLNSGKTYTFPADGAPHSFDAGWPASKGFSFRLVGADGRELTPLRDQAAACVTVAQPYVLLSSPSCGHLTVESGGMPDNDAAVGETRLSNGKVWHGKGIAETIEVEPGTYTAEAGFVWLPDKWYGKSTAGPVTVEACAAPEPTTTECPTCKAVQEPVITPVCGPANDEIEAPEGITLLSSGWDGNTFTAKFVTLDGWHYGDDDTPGKVHTWTYTDKDEKCDSTPPTTTPTTPAETPAPPSPTSPSEVTTPAAEPSETPTSEPSQPTSTPTTTMPTSSPGDPSSPSLEPSTPASSPTSGDSISVPEATTTVPPHESPEGESPEEDGEHPTRPATPTGPATASVTATASLLAPTAGPGTAKSPASPVPALPTSPSTASTAPQADLNATTAGTRAPSTAPVAPSATATVMSAASEGDVASKGGELAYTGAGNALGVLAACGVALILVGYITRRSQR